MLVIQYAVLMIASLIATYLAINSNTPDKRLLNGMLSGLLNAVTALGSFEIVSIENAEEIVEQNGSEYVVMTVETVSYGSNTLGVLFIVLATVSLVYVFTGAYKKLEDDTGE